jgi:hypothetical protein
MESKKRAVIVAAGIVVALLIGIAAGVAYQKTQPVMLHIDDVRGTNVINTHEIALSEKGSISMNTGGEFVQKNNITQYWITLSKN